MRIVVSVKDKKIIDYIKMQNRINNADLSRDLNLNYRTTWQHLKKLEKYGLIKRVSKSCYSVVEGI